MTRMMGRFLGTAAMVGALLGASPSAMAQRIRSVGDYYGFGVEGTIGRGTNVLPGGPSDGGVPSLGASSGMTDYGSGYAGYSPARSYRRSAPMASSPVAPYLTKQYYSPGDGFLYPLYYNPATRAYFYYPVRH